MIQMIVPTELTFYLVFNAGNELASYGVIGPGMVFATGQPKMFAYFDKDQFLAVLGNYIDVTGEEFLKDFGDVVANAELVAASVPLAP